MLTVPKIQSSLLESAILEILLIFPTSKIFHYHEKGLGFINLDLLHNCLQTAL
jgi:hypothetical protein